MRLNINLQRGGKRNFIWHDGIYSDWCYKAHGLVAKNNDPRDQNSRPLFS